MCAAAGAARAAICYDGPTEGSEKAIALAARPTRTRVGKRAPKSDTKSEAASLPKPEHRLVDIDPWAVLLEQLMDVSEEGRATSEPAQGGTNDQPEPRRSAKKGRRR